MTDKNDDTLVSLEKLNLPNYSVTEDGRVWSKIKNDFMRTHLDKRGYVRVGLVNTEGKQAQYTVHSLVAKTFIPNPKGLPQVDHIDGNKTNNNVSNLRWCTNRENAHFAMQIGLIPHAVFIRDEVVRNICERLSKGETVASIAHDTGFSYDAITSVRLRRSWTHISCNYEFPETNKQNYPSQEKMVGIITMMADGESNAAIFAKYPDVRRETVYRTRQGKIHKKLIAEVCNRKSIPNWSA